MKFLEEINEQTLLIIDNELKEKILLEINNYPKLLNIKLMTKSEFIKHYFYDYNEETIYYLTTKYNLTVSNAKIYLDNLKYVLNLDSNLEKITFLKEMYNDLITNNLLILDNLFTDYLEKTNLVVLEKETFDPFYLNIFDTYQATYYDLTYQDYDKSIPTYHFKTLEEECSFLFNEISSLIKSGVREENIKITNVTSEYEPFFRRFKNLYNIQVNNLETSSIYGTIVAKNVLAMTKENKSKEEILNYLEQYKEKDIYNLIFKVLNKYYFTDNLQDVSELIKEDFKNTNLKEIKYKDAVSVTTFNSHLFSENDYVFLVGFNLENIPKTYKDIDYLNDTLKQEIGLFTSLEKNKLEHLKVLKHLKNIEKLTISYKDSDPYKSYYPANLLEEINVKEQETANLNQSSNLYNKIKLVNQLDLMIKYGTKESETSVLLNTYQDIPYLTYNNKWMGITNFKMDKITLSYTSLNNYYHCAFRYYIDNVLKLNIYEDTFKIFIGNLFHFVLSKMFDANFDLENEFTNYLTTREFTKKEEFYLTILKEELNKIINIIKYHHQLSGLDKVKLETEIKLKYQDNLTFKGIIDKVMYKEKDNQTYVSLIDYKTGTPKTDMTNLIYGIDMQLPTYVYLIKKSNVFLNPQVVGFYFEQIINEKTTFNQKKDLETTLKDSLKLNGYSINDEYLVNMFDESYQNSEMIKGMKTTSKGFSHYTKVITKEEIDNLVHLVDLKIKEAFKEIQEGNFTINPKVIGTENVGCSFCKYQDLCFKSGSDYVYLEKKDDLSYLGGEENA